MTELRFKQKVKADAQLLMDNLTFEEQMRLAYTPLVISHMAWHYAEKAAAMARDERIGELKSASRALRQIRADYLHFLKRDLNERHIQAIFDETDRLMGQCSLDLFQLFFVVKENINKLYPKADHDLLRSNAVISLMMIRLLKWHNARMDKVLQERIPGIEGSKLPVQMRQLAKVMEQYAGDIELDENEFNMSLCKKILENNINKIQFNIS